MWPNRVGGISAACAEAFRPYNPVLASLTGTCYWWGWIPTCGLTALLSAAAFQHWYFPSLPVEAVAIGIVCFFTFVNLCGIVWVARLAIPIATAPRLISTSRLDGAMIVPLRVVVTHSPTPNIPDLCLGFKQFRKTIDVRSTRVADHEIAKPALTPCLHVERQLLRCERIIV